MSCKLAWNVHEYQLPPKNIHWSVALLLISIVALFVTFCVTFMLWKAVLKVDLHHRIPRATHTHPGKKTALKRFSPSPPPPPLNQQISSMDMRLNYPHISWCHFTEHMGVCCTYYTVLYGTIRYYTVLYGNIRFYTVLHGSTRFYTVLYGTMRFYTVLYGTTRFYTVLYGTMRL